MPSSVAMCCHRGVVIVWLVAANRSFGVAVVVGVAVGSGVGVLLAVAVVAVHSRTGGFA